MPRTVRASAANLCYHVLNRGNNRASVFHKDGDFDAFVDLLAEAKLRNPIRILAYCVLSNHFHLALWPLGGRKKITGPHNEALIVEYRPCSVREAEPWKSQQGCATC